MGFTIHFGHCVHEPDLYTNLKTTQLLCSSYLTLTIYPSLYPQSCCIGWWRETSQLPPSLMRRAIREWAGTATLIIELIWTKVRFHCFVQLESCCVMLFAAMWQMNHLTSRYTTDMSGTGQDIKVHAFTWNDHHSGAHFAMHLLIYTSKWSWWWWRSFWYYRWSWCLPPIGLDRGKATWIQLCCLYSLVFSSWWWCVMPSRPRNLGHSSRTGICDLSMCPRCLLCDWMMNMNGLYLAIVRSTKSSNGVLSSLRCSVWWHRRLMAQRPHLDIFWISPVLSVVWSSRYMSSRDLNMYKPNSKRFALLWLFDICTFNPVYTLSLWSVGANGHLHFNSGYRRTTHLQRPTGYRARAKIPNLVFSKYIS